MPDNDDIDIKPRRGCWMPILLVVFGLPVLLIGIAITILAWRESAASARLEERIAAMRAEGLPVDADSLNSFYRSNTSDEQTQEWEQLLDEISSDAFQKSINGVPSFDRQLSREELFAVPGAPWLAEKRTREFLDQWSQLHDRAMQLSMAAKPTRWDMELSLNVDLDRTQQLRSVERLLSLRGQLAIYDSDGAATTRAINALFRLPNVTAGEPFLISQLVRAAVGGKATALLKAALEQGVLRQHEIELLLPQVLERTTVGDAWRMGIVGERALALPLIRGMSDEEGHPASSLPFRSSDANFYLEVMERMLELSSDDPVEFYAGARKLEEEFSSQRNDMSFFERFDKMMSTTVTPSLGNVAVAHCRSAFQNRLAALAMGVRLYELENERLPEQLADVAKFGVDSAKLVPPGGRPFGYRQEADGSALLWGFSLQNGKNNAVPDLPPVPGASKSSDDEAELWLYVLKPSRAK